MVVMTPVLTCQLLFSVSAIVLNLLAIYCLRQRITKGNQNQLLLQQHLAFINIVKTIYDYVPWAIYHFNMEWYLRNEAYFSVVEVNMTTLIFCCNLLITLDRYCIVYVYYTYLLGEGN